MSKQCGIVRHFERDDPHRKRMRLESRNNSNTTEERNPDFQRRPRISNSNSKNGGSSNSSTSSSFTSSSRSNRFADVDMRKSRVNQSPPGSSPHWNKPPQRFSNSDGRNNFPRGHNPRDGWRNQRNDHLPQQERSSPPRNTIHRRLSQQQSPPHLQRAHSWKQERPVHQQYSPPRAKSWRENSEPRHSSPPLLLQQRARKERREEPNNAPQRNSISNSKKNRMMMRGNLRGPHNNNNNNALQSRTGGGDPSKRGAKADSSPKMGGGTTPDLISPEDTIPPSVELVAAAAKRKAQSSSSGRCTMQDAVEEVKANRQHHNKTASCFCGFTDSESRTVETTELTEPSIAASTDTTTCKTLPNTTKTAAAAINTTQPLALPTAVVVWKGPASLQGIDEEFSASLQEGRIPKKKRTIAYSGVESSSPPPPSSRSGLNAAKSSISTASAKSGDTQNACPKRNATRVSPKSSNNKRKFQKATSLEDTDSSEEECWSEDEPPVKKCRGKSKKGDDKDCDCKDPSLVTVGSRVSVYWDGEDEYFAGKVTKHRSGAKKPFYVVYDDGDKEWINFDVERFRLLSRSKVKQEKGTDKLSTGSKEESNKGKGKKKGISQGKREFTDAKCDRVSVISDRKENNDASRSRKEVSPGRSDIGKQGDTASTNCLPFSKNTNSRKNGTNNMMSQSKTDPKEEKEQKNEETLPTSEQPVSPDKKSIGISSLAPDERLTSQKCEDEDWVSAGIVKDSSDSETDEEQLMEFASKMFGINRPIARRKDCGFDKPSAKDTTPASIKPESIWEIDWYAADVPISISEKVKLGRRRSSRGETVSYALASPKRKADVKFLSAKERREAKARCDAQQQDEELKRKKEESRPLTAAEISAILGEDKSNEMAPGWVRRSVRQPSKSTLNAPRVKALLEKLRSNDSDMVVLKMKKYCSDLDTPQIVIDAALDALEENTNCEALYIQNFNEGMRDEQVMHLLRILKRPACKIWCLNIGETYNVQTETWEKFAEGLKQTKITHMYASEHTISTELKDQIRSTIRNNRSKHTMHSDPKNLDTIVQCTHCWWNPINTKALRPYIKSRGYEQILHDAEAQGLQGTMSGATLS